MEIDSIQPFNKKQILLDWINTVDEPKCLLVSEIDQLKDGIVFLEILKNYLKKIDLLKFFQNEIKSVILQDIKSRYDLIYKILLEFFEHDFLRRFQPVGKLYNNQNFLLEFIEVFKSLFDGFGGYISNDNEDCNEMNHENEDMHEENQFQNQCQLSEKNLEIGKSMSMFSNQMIESEFDLKSKYMLPSPKNSESPEKKNYNFNKNFVTDSNWNENSCIQSIHNEKNVQKIQNIQNIQNMHNIQHFALSPYQPVNENDKMEISKLNFDILQDSKLTNLNTDVDYTYIGREYLKTKSPEKQISSRDREKENSNPNYNLVFNRDRESDYTKISNSALKNKNIKKFLHHHDMSLISKTEIKNRSISPLHSKREVTSEKNNCLRDSREVNHEKEVNRSVINYISNTTNNSFISNSQINFDFNSLYSNRERSEMFLFRGIPFPQTSNKNSNLILDINFHRINFFRFIRPTLPIVDVDFKSCKKFKPNDGQIKNSIKKLLDNKEKIPEVTERTERTERCDKFDKIDKVDKTDRTELQEKFSHATFSSFNYQNKPSGKNRLLI